MHCVLPLSSLKIGPGRRCSVVDAFPVPENQCCQRRHLDRSWTLVSGSRLPSRWGDRFHISSLVDSPIPPSTVLYLVPVLSTDRALRSQGRVILAECNLSLATACARPHVLKFREKPGDKGWRCRFLCPERILLGNSFLNLAVSSPALLFPVTYQQGPTKK